MSITEFITARLAEDEQTAQRNIGKVPGGQHGLGDDEQYGPSYPDYQTYNDDDTDAADAYITRFRPLRMLREVDAKRRITEIHQVGSDPCDAHGPDLRSVPCETLLWLAVAYSDHPDYDGTWKP